MYDGLFLAGFGLFEYGVACLSPEAAWIIGGLVLIGLALSPATRRKSKP